MTNRNWRLGAVLLVAAGFVALAHAETLEEVQKKIVAAAEKVKSYSSDLNMVMEMKSEAMTMDSKGQGTFEFMRDGNKMKSRMELKSTGMVKFGDQETKNDSTVLSISDGEYNYVLNDQAGTKTAVKTKVEPQSTGIATKELFDIWAKEHDLKLMPDEKVDGKDAYVIEATPKKPGGGKLINYFAKDSGLLVKMVTLTPEGKPMQTLSYSNVKLNPDIKPDRFVFKAPEGVEVRDMSSMKPGGQP